MHPLVLLRSVGGLGFVDMVASRFVLYMEVRGRTKKQAKNNLGSRGFGGEGDGRRGSLGDGGFRVKVIFVCTADRLCAVRGRHVQESLSLVSLTL